MGASPHPETTIRRRTAGFSLVELLVVIGIIGVLVSLILPLISHVRRHARQTVCLGNLHQIGIGIASYAMDNDGSIPFGPKAPLFSPVNFYPRTGVVTSLISLQDGRPVGLGLMLSKQIFNTRHVLFCPDTDQENLADLELSLVGKGQAQCDYYYRHASGSSLYADATTDHLRLSGLGINSQGNPIRALAIDVNFLALPQLAGFGGYTRTCHGGQTANCLYSDGHAAVLDNRHNAYTVDATTNLANSFSKILDVFELADQQ